MASFILWWFFLPRGGFLHSDCAQGLNDSTGGRFYGFAYCFWNVSGRPAASSVRAAPCQLPRRGSFCTGLWGVGVVGNGSVLSRAERHIGRSLHTLTDESKWATLVAPIIDNCPLSIINSDRTVNCPLSTPPKIVNCQLIIPFAQKARRKRNGGPWLQFWVYRTERAYSVGVMPNFSLNWREKW